MMRLQYTIGKVSKKTVAELRRACGIMVALASTIFLVWAVWSSFDRLPAELMHPRFVILLAGLAVGYLGINQILGTGWYVLIRELEPGRMEWASALAIFNRTQFYKYMPGNVFHMVGRFAMARDCGVSARTLAFAQAGEIATQLIVAGLIAVLFGGRLLGVLVSGHYSELRLLIIPALILLLAALLYAASRIHRSRGFAVRIARACTLALPVYAAFLALSGGCAVAIIYSIAPRPLIGVAELIGIFAVSWLIGFVVPGAPGGLGAREATVVVCLNLLGVGLPLATATALSHRIVTIGGDALAAGLGWAIMRRAHPVSDALAAGSGPAGSST